VILGYFSVESVNRKLVYEREVEITKA